MATIISLAYQPAKSAYAELYRFNRQVVDTMQLVAGHGIKGDFKAGRNPKRQLNIMSRATLNELSASGFQTNPDEMGEQIVLDRIEVAALLKGTRLQLGDAAVVEITMLRTGCAWMALVQGRENAIEETVGKLGVLASIVTSGTIRVGDRVKILQPQPTD